MAEACTLAPWLTAFAMLYRPLSITAIANVIFAIILGVSYLVRGIATLGLGVRFQRVMFLVAVLALSAWGLSSLEQWPNWPWRLSTLRSLADFSSLIPASLSIVLAIVFLAWRGLRLAQKPLSVLDARAKFQLGVVAFTLFVLVSLYAVEPAEINVILAAFFFCQLLAIGLTRVETIGEQPGGKRSQFGAWWLGMLSLCTAAVVLAAGAVMGAITGVGLEYVLTLLQPLLVIVSVLSAVVVIPILFLFGVAIDWLVDLISLRWAALEGQFATVEPAQLTPEPGASSPAVEFITRALGCGKGLAVLLVVILIVAGVAWAAGRLQARDSSAEDEEHESIWSAGRWAARLRRQLGHGLKRLSGAAGLLARLGANGFLTALTIRRIYAQLQKLAGRRGYPRRPALTPYEYLPALYECFPAQRAELLHITEAYIGVHYGELPERAEEMAEIHAAWERIREAHVSV
ncbi:MAG: DUF4129 domain-containing protein [Thermoflexales bacterium]|nr:DUF4129 domain-containing protein [Thermoflexales bacterium]